MTKHTSSLIRPQYDRRDFLKISAAGMIIATVPTLGACEQETPPVITTGNNQLPSRTLPHLAGGITRWDFRPAEKGAVFISDLSRCTPTARLTRSFRPNRWQLTDFETEEGVKGVMVSAYPNQNCGELTLPLGISGVYKIFLGINYTKTNIDNGSPHGQLEVKLDNDSGFRRVAMEGGVNNETGDLKVGVNNYNHKSIQETYWKTADVTDRALIFRQMEPPYNFPMFEGVSNLSYIKLVPLTAEEEHVWKTNGPTTETRRLGIIFCTGQLTGHTSGTFTFHTTDKQWFRNEFTPYVNSDIGIFIFEAMRGNFCLFKTKLGDVGNDENRWDDNWVEPLTAFTDLAHEHGIKIFAAQRMIGVQYPMNRAPIGYARNYWANPEWAKRDREGAPLTNLSLAYSGVRAHWLGLLREALDRNIDGIQLHLNRSTPFVYYEEPVVSSFTDKYGEDPRELPENDPRWQIHCAGFVTDYLREVRALLDENPGRELGITIYGEPHKYDDDAAPFHPIRYGCDVETWIREGLVNYIMPSPRISRALLRQWRTIGGNRIHLWPDLMPRNQMAADYARLAKHYYESGADGLCLWDAERRCGRLSEWAAVQNLGNREWLDTLEHKAPDFYRRVPMKLFGGFSVRESFHDG